MLKFVFVIYNRCVALIAYGPWGPLHRLSIFVFRKLYRISESPRPQHKRLGDFFLRERPYPEVRSSLVAPVEAILLEGPQPISESVSVKGLIYEWKAFPEWSETLRSGWFWNFYLAPQHYHWFHAPCGGHQLEACRISGQYYPVNALGRWLSPSLYRENERMSFRWRSSEFGLVTLLCVGALGVSRIRSEVGQIPMDQGWIKVKDQLSAGERLGAFELGSSALLLVEKVSPRIELPSDIRLAEALV